jgi:hypothetical protein
MALNASIELNGLRSIRACPSVRAGEFPRSWLLANTVPRSTGTPKWSRRLLNPGKFENRLLGPTIYFYLVFNAFNCQDGRRDRHLWDRLRGCYMTSRIGIGLRTIGQASALTGARCGDGIGVV